MRGVRRAAAIRQGRLTGAKFSLACNWGWREKAEEAEDKTLEVVGLPEEYKR